MAGRPSVHYIVEQPGSLGLHEPQVDDKQIGTWTTSNSVVDGCDAAEPDEREDFQWAT